MEKTQLVNNEEKKQILKYLKKSKSLVSISKLSKELKINYYKIQILMRELEQDKKIKITLKKRNTYLELIWNISQLWNI